MDNSIIRSEILISYPYVFTIVDNILANIKEIEPDTTQTRDSILYSFIEKAKLEHIETTWKDRYKFGVTLLTCHYITEAQGKAVNSGLLVRQKSGSSENGSETEYMRPSMSNFGEFATTEFGRQWESVKNNLIKGSFSRRCV